MGLAYDVTGDTDYLDGVAEAMDYILGRNANENSFVTGYGVDGYVTANPHHRYWCHEMKADWPWAPSGCLSGGMNSNMNDPMIQGAGYKIGELAPMLCYLDKNDAWSVNEITINWNSPLAWAASFLDDQGNDESGAVPTPPTGDEPGELTLGDVNCDGTVDIRDVLVLNQNLLAGTKLTEQGILNADVDQDGAPTAADALAILQYTIGLVKSFPV
jgi:endoglucanase